MPNAKYAVPSCPTDCGNLENLPDTSFEDCVEAMGIYESEICEILITIPDAVGDASVEPATDDPADLLSWYTTNVGDSPAAIRKIICIGDMSSGENETAQFSKRREKVIGLKEFTVNATIDDMGDDNRDFMRQLECGLSVVFWFKTIGGKFFGGVTGIWANISNVNLPLDRGENNYEVATMEIKWNAAAAPPRNDDFV